MKNTLQPVTIVDDRSDNSDEEEAGEESMSHAAAAKAFELCIQWVQQQPEGTVTNVTTLRQWQAFAAKKRLNSLQQCHITDSFKQ